MFPTPAAMWRNYKLAIHNTADRNGDIMKGKVKMFNAERGFGFITGDDGKDVYVHTSMIEGGAALSVGDAVEYEVEAGQKGPRAKGVKKI